MASPVFYSCSPFGTGDIKNGSPTKAITSGLMTLSVAQTGNIGVGDKVVSTTSTVYIAPCTIGFDSGSTEILPEQIIEGQTSGAQAKVRYCEVTSGTWGAGTAAGTIYVAKVISGTFQNNEDLDVGGNTNVATTDGTLTGNMSTTFVVKTATGGTPGNHSAESVTSISHEYASINAFQSGYRDANHINNNSLVSADVVAHCCCYYDHDDQTLDTTKADFDMGAASRTDATRYIQIFTPVGGEESINDQRHAGTWNTNKYVMSMTNTQGIQQSGYGSFMKIFGLQMEFASMSSDLLGLIDIDNDNSEDPTIEVAYCIGRDASGATQNNSSFIFEYNANGCKIVAWNCIVYDFTQFQSAAFWCLDPDGGNEIETYNVTVHNCEIEFYIQTGTVSNVFECVNSLGQDESGGGFNVFSNDGVDDFTNSSYNCSDDNSQPGTNGQNGEVTFVNEGADNFQLDTTDTVAKENGTANPNNSRFQDDITGTIRPATWSIGAWEPDQGRTTKNTDSWGLGAFHGQSFRMAQ